MTNVLKKIVDKRSASLAHTLLVTDIPETLDKSTRSLFEALNKPSFGFILECKKASPSKGIIRDDFNVDDIATSYSSYADAISVLTEPDFFHGDFRYLERVAKQCAQPILCKDFILSPEHIRLARFYGADAVLLMLSVLDDEQYLACAKIAARLDMDVLTEVHDEAELARAIALDAKIIGINNRNLKTLNTAFTPTERLANHVPKDRLIVTESGIESHADILHLANYANACLVGSSIMSHANLTKAVENLIYGDIKVCGVTNQADVDMLNSMPCSRIGQIFVPTSKRFVRTDAKPFASQTPKTGVFDGAYHSVTDIIETTRHHGLVGIQLHGKDDQSLIAELKQRLPNTLLSKVIHVAADTSIEALGNKLSESDVDEYLLDTMVNSHLGGTGVTFDWSLLDSLDLSRIRIAGGINPDNVQTLKSHGAVNIDLASGSEASAGIKSANKLNQLFNNAKINSKRGNYEPS